VRMAAAVMILPGIGDSYVSSRVRLLFALALTAIVAPVVADTLPPEPAAPLALGVLIVGEVIIGLFMGMLSRLLMTAVDTAGVVIAVNMGLAAAVAFNPTQATQGTVVGVFLSMLGLVLVFVTNLHHLMIMAVVDSYTLFTPGTFLPGGDAADVIVMMISRSFQIGIQIAAPFILMAIVLNLGLGLISRLMPQLQVYFVALPLQIMFGLIVMGVVLSAGMAFWLHAVEDTLRGYVG